jgi:hypothetical protein
MKPKKTSPTQRTLAELRKLGYTAAITEKWNSFAKIRQDLFGIIDIIAIWSAFGAGDIYKSGGIMGIQTCAGASHSARVAKALAEPRLKTWLEAGGLFEVWSWAKRGKRGEQKLWTLRRETVTLADLGGDHKLGTESGGAPSF